ncbi:MAG: ANTAR domain-containing protein, partial [Rhodococcus sp. (in: high G+C Gram-positive bacteria)]
LMTSDLDWNAASEGGDGWEQLASLERVEVYQATGMIIGQLDIGPVEALARLRAHAYLAGQTASEVAWDIVERRLVLTPDDHPAAGNNLGSIG